MTRTDAARAEEEKPVSGWSSGSDEARMREIALAVVNEVGAGLKLGEQIAAIDARVGDLETVSRAHSDSLVVLIRRLDALEAAAKPLNPGVKGNNHGSCGTAVGGSGIASMIQLPDGTWIGSGGGG